MNSNEPRSVSDQDFKQQVIEASTPVLVDFWAEWCGPCRSIAPTLEQLAEEHPGIAIRKLNVDENPVITGEQGVRSIPTLKLFKDGAVIDTLVGNQSRRSLEALILKHS